MEAIIDLNDIRVYSYHGCLQEETLAGSDYRVNLQVRVGDVSDAVVSDLLENTVDYVLLNRIVKEEMKIPSKLLETVAHRILVRIFKEEPRCEWAKISVSKLNPPIGGDVNSVSVTISSKRF